MTEETQSMKTEDLIATLAAEPAPPPAASLERRAGMGAVAGLAVTVVLFLAVLGPRANLGAALSDPVVLAKTLMPLLLALFAGALALRSARPAVPSGVPGRIVWLVPAAVGALFFWALGATEAGQRLVAFLGHSTQVCIPAITVLSLPILAGLIHAMRGGAPVHPARSGALAGLAAAGMAAAIYSLFCTEDSPLFYAVWYSVAIGVATGIGAVVGRRFLRW